VPYNPGAIPKSAYAPSECFVADTQQSAEESVISAIPNFVDTAGNSPLFGTQSLNDNSTNKTEFYHPPIGRQKTNPMIVHWKNVRH
jgi:hypothetical protein